jgi:osmotically-inducible protein OsmY
MLDSTTRGSSPRELRGEERKLWVRVRQTLWDYEPLRASHAEIVIWVQGGDVRLTGRVRTLAQKTIASVLVARVPEVDAVANELIADAEVVRSVADTLARDSRVAPYVLQVSARHGLVALTGEVPDEETRQAAMEVAALAPLVDAVRDRLTVGGPRFAPYALAPLQATAGALPAAEAEEPVAAR